MKKNISMLMLGDYSSFTGFSTVTKNLKRHWKRVFGDNLKMDIVAINYFGDDFVEEDGTRVISAKMKDRQKDDFGRHVFLSTVDQGNYDLLFINQDMGVVIPMVKHLKEMKERKKKENRRQFKSIYYFPVDFSLFGNIGAGLDFFDALYTYTNWAKREILALHPNLFKKIHVLPHGSDTDSFYPMDLNAKMRFRYEYFGENAKKFIVSNINRNQPRKDIPTTIFGFLEYKTEFNPDCFLYLHMHPKDPMGWDIRQIMAQTPIIEGVDYMFPNEEDQNKGCSVSKLNQIYNASDVYLTTATGGGFELTVIEAMACMVPVIAPNQTSFSELGADGRAWLLEGLYPIVNQVDNIVRFQSDMYEVADFLDMIQKGKNEHEMFERLDKAYSYACSLDWEQIAGVFALEIEKLG